MLNIGESTSAAALPATAATDVDLGAVLVSTRHEQSLLSPPPEPSFLQTHAAQAAGSVSRTGSAAVADSTRSNSSSSGSSNSSRRRGVPLQRGPKGVATPSFESTNAKSGGSAAESPMLVPSSILPIPPPPGSSGSPRRPSEQEEGEGAGSMRVERNNNESGVATDGDMLDDDEGDRHDSARRYHNHHLNHNIHSLLPAAPANHSNSATMNGSASQHFQPALSVSSTMELSQGSITAAVAGGGEGACAPAGVGPEDGHNSAAPAAGFSLIPTDYLSSQRFAGVSEPPSYGTGPSSGAAGPGEDSGEGPAGVDFWARFFSACQSYHNHQRQAGSTGPRRKAFGWCALHSRPRAAAFLDATALPGVMLCRADNECHVVPFDPNAGTTHSRHRTRPQLLNAVALVQSSTHPAAVAVAAAALTMTPPQQAFRDPAVDYMRPPVAMAAAARAHHHHGQGPPSSATGHEVCVIHGKKRSVRNLSYSAEMGGWHCSRSPCQVSLRELGGPSGNGGNSDRAPPPPFSQHPPAPAIVAGDGSTHQLLPEGYGVAPRRGPGPHRRDTAAPLSTAFASGASPHHSLMAAHGNDHSNGHSHGQVLALGFDPSAGVQRMPSPGAMSIGTPQGLPMAPLLPVGGPGTPQALLDAASTQSGGDLSRTSTGGFVGRTGSTPGLPFLAHPSNAPPQGLVFGGAFFGSPGEGQAAGHTPSAGALSDVSFSSLIVGRANTHDNLREGLLSSVGTSPDALLSGSVGGGAPPPNLVLPFTTAGVAAGGGSSAPARADPRQCLGLFTPAIPPSHRSDPRPDPMASFSVTQQQHPSERDSQTPYGAGGGRGGGRFGGCDYGRRRAAPVGGSSGGGGYEQYLQEQYSAPLAASSAPPTATGQSPSPSSERAGAASSSAGFVVTTHNTGPAQHERTHPYPPQAAAHAHYPYHQQHHNSAHNNNIYFSQPSDSYADPLQQQHQQPPHAYPPHTHEHHPQPSPMYPPPPTASASHSSNHQRNHPHGHATAVPAATSSASASYHHHPNPTPSSYESVGAGLYTASTASHPQQQQHQPHQQQQFHTYAQQQQQQHQIQQRYPPQHQHTSGSSFLQPQQQPQQQRMRHSHDQQQQQRVTQQAYPPASTGAPPHNQLHQQYQHQQQQQQSFQNNSGGGGGGAYTQYVGW